MRTTSVICRFLSLLDVTLILLGLTMILLAHSQMTAAQAERNKQAAESGDLPTLDVVYLYAVTEEARDKDCYALGPDRRPDFSQRIRTEVADDLRKQFGGKPGTKPVVVLLLSKKGFSGVWEKRQKGIESNWDVDIMLMPYPFEEEP